MKNESSSGVWTSGVIFILTVLIITACGPSVVEETSPVSPEPDSIFDPMALELPTEPLLQGREIWMRTCAKCHIPGLGGAPMIADLKDWAPRIAKGKETLYDHAINGFVGPLYNEMPAKGGFTDLSDEEVKLAVDFVVFASQ